MTSNFLLQIPPEPKDISRQISVLRDKLNHASDTEWDSDRLTVWFGNKIPKYLWDNWKEELKPRGFTWQKFLKLLSHRTDMFLLWSKDFYKWDDFVREVIKLLESPLGQDIAKR